MEPKPQSCWQKARKPLVIVGGVALIVGVVVLIFVIVRFYGTGFDGYNKVSIARIIRGSSSGTVTRTEEYQPGKALWDWLQLLIAPAVIALLGVGFTIGQQRRDQRLTDQRAKTEQKIAEDNQREVALQDYINKMSELLLDKQLRDSSENTEVRKIAQVRVLTVLTRLDANRKKSVLQFLYVSGLLDREKPIVNLYGANLNGINFSGANLSKANLFAVDLSAADLRAADLSGADLRAVDFSGADLSAADLRAADLSGADLSGANLSNADLSGATVTQEQWEKAKSLSGTILPDGPKHP